MSRAAAVNDDDTFLDIVEGSFGDDDDVSLLTFWGQKTLIPVLEKALELLKAEPPDGA